MKSKTRALLIRMQEINIVAGVIALVMAAIMETIKSNALFPIAESLFLFAVLTATRKRSQLTNPLAILLED